jgi:radical SAM superfamily enzyme YgiQ (UPF0313 family)
MRSSRQKLAACSVLPAHITDVLGDAGLAAAVAERRPDVLAMTLYVWNVARSLFLASNVKRLVPGTRVIVGGPEVTPDNAWVIHHPAVDAGVFGEGESRICTLAEALLADASADRVPGAFFRSDGHVRTNADQPDRWDLRSCPYPYLDGSIEPSTDGTIFLETVRGCPFKCRYCYYHKAFHSVRLHPKASVEKVLDFAYSPETRVREIYLMDPTFNARRGFRGILSSMARRRLRKEVAIHTELRPDLLARADVGLMKDAGLRSAEIGLQTTNEAALREAGRRGDPEKTARGANLLKEAGIDVTTGIIVGLPRDTRLGFSRTLKWLKQTEAYSVVHPFVLSVLPGTDFRARAEELGLTYDRRPPYYVRSTPTFPEDAFRSALLECEQTFDMELDSIPLPSLVDTGAVGVALPEQTEYISKWIVDGPEAGRWKSVLPEVVAKASDPFTLWFRGDRTDAAEAAMFRIIHEFALANPHAVLNVVLEFSEGPDEPFFQQAIELAGDPGLFINRSYQPLYEEGEVVTPSFTVILPDPGSAARRDRVQEQLEGSATVVWEWQMPDVGRLKKSATPLLISATMADMGALIDPVLNVLEQTHRDQLDEVLFRDLLVQQVWEYRTRQLDPAYLFPERILSTERP